MLIGIIMRINSKLRIKTKFSRRIKIPRCQSFRDKKHDYTRHEKHKVSFHL